MKIAASLILLTCSMTAAAQRTVVVHDPTKASTSELKLSAAEESVLKAALVPVRKMISADTCDEDVAPAGVARGSFTRPGVSETIIFYQFCQTGNGFGWVGLVVSENGRVTANFVSEAGWSVDAGRVADINGNGLDEFTLAYSGGLHQGQGGVGVDLMEFVGGNPTGLGWYKAEEFGPTESSTSWKLTAKPGAKPVFYKQKYVSNEGSDPRRVGANAITKLGKPYSKFVAVK